jgi:hypothetical protein
MFTYAVIGALVVGGILSVPGVSRVLEIWINRWLGPVLLVVGVVLLELLQIRLGGGLSVEKLKNRFAQGSVVGATVLGIVFALAFCPFSAALFFGSLIPLAASHESSVLLPSLFGLGTGLPVLLFAVLIARGSRYIGKVFNNLSSVEVWARRVTGTIFVGIGIYFSLLYVFEVAG